MTADVEKNSALSGDDLRSVVRDRYGEIAEKERPAQRAEQVGRAVGYSESELGAVPEGANLGLGCGNPVALAALRPGQVVLDLGSGAGFDSFLAASAVGSEGRVFGVDMTEAMVEKARQNATAAGVTNVEFRLGHIESLPLDDSSVDVVLSNCVINLSPQKDRVFAEAFRVLRPGGSLMISDLVTTGELPESVRQSLPAYVGCIGGVGSKDDYVRMLGEAGFAEVTIVDEQPGATLLGISDPDSLAANPEALQCLSTDPVLSELLRSAPLEDLLVAAKLVVSAKISARKG
jgi:arsenite methyltransferase